MRWRFNLLQLIALLLLLGISLYKIFPISFITALIIFIIILFVSIVGFCLRGNDKVARDQGSIIEQLLFSILIISFGVALISFSAHKLKFENSIVKFVPQKGGNVICEGVVTGVFRYDYGDKLILNKLRCLKKDALVPLSGKLRVSIGEGPWFLQKSFFMGDRVRLKSRIKRPRELQNFERTSIENYCLVKGISAVGYIKGARWIVKIGEEKNILNNLLESWRNSVLKASYVGLGDSESYQLVRALVLGDKTGFKRWELDKYKELGVIHLLVVSGLHVGILAAISWWGVIMLGSLFSPVFGQRDLRVAASVVSCVLIWLFIALTGFGTPAVRAGLLGSVCFCAVILKRDHNAWDALSLTAIIILVVNPASLFDISFQLTFAAVIGILVFSRFFRLGGATICDKVCSFIWNIFMVSMGASAGVFPLLAYHFEKVPLLGPFISMVLSPLITLIIVPISLLAAIFAPFYEALSVQLFSLLSRPAGIFVSVSDAMATGLGWSLLSASPDLYEILALYGLIILIIYWRSFKHWKIAVLALTIFLGAKLIMTYPVEITEGKLAVTFLDVGQGSAVVVKLPDGGVTLIDGGGVKGSNTDIGKSVLEPFLSRFGIERVDRVVITHPHPDHYLGLGHIIENYKPGICMVASYPWDDLLDDEAVLWNRFMGQIEMAGVKVEHLEPGVWEEAGVNFEVFSPPAEIPNGWSVNDSSTIIKITYDAVSFLITGDAEAHAEAFIVDGDFEVQSTVLQVPHHGSATSSSNMFLDSVAPQYGVIQVGAFNNYGFPSPEVLNRFEERGIKIYRTDQDGALSFITDGEQLKIFSAADKEN